MSSLRTNDRRATTHKLSTTVPVQSAPATMRFRFTCDMWRCMKSFSLNEWRNSMSVAVHR